MIQHSDFLRETVVSLVVAILVWAFLEALVWIAIWLASERPWRRFQAAYQHVERGFSRFARHRRLAIITVFFLVFAGRIAMLPVFPVPPPKIVDEFTQLLSGDTLAHWRVTNPTHPMWRYFETMFVNQHPTYNAMYPPGTGLFLAVGQILTGHPWYGMLLSIALAAAALCWMLQGWMPPRWALWGALVFVLFAAKNTLTENYLGEGVLVLGGALVLGAIPRIVKRRSLAAAFWLGLGIALLAITRPYEGAIFVAAVGIGGIWWAWSAGLRTSGLLKRVAFPVAAILLPVFVWAGYLNWRTTGHTLLAPYQLNLVKQHLTRPFLWQKPANPPPHYDYPELASFYDQWEMDWWRKTQAFPRGVAILFLEKVEVAYWAVVWPLGVFLALGCYELLKRRKHRFLPIVLIVFALGVSLEAYQLVPRYLAMTWGLVILLAIYGIRYAAVWRRKSHQGLRLSKAATVFVPGALLVCNFAFLGYLLPHGGEPWYWARWQALHALQALPGKQLVIVRYSPAHHPEEWVYNRADIDGAKVVWARYAPQTQDADLLQYFRDRTVWLLEPDGRQVKITLYSERDMADTASDVGAFRIICNDSVCEDLKKQLRLAR